jgi:hypothetical protein
MDKRNKEGAYMSGKNIGGAAVIIACGLMAGLLLAGCSTFGGKEVPPITVGEIVQMSKSGMPAADIVAKLHESGTIYRLKASELASLKEQGVSAEVIDYMQKTYLRAVQHDQRLQDDSYWARSNDNYWYGGTSAGWPYDPMWSGPGDSGERGGESHHDRR